MQLFVVDDDPVVCARYLDDRRLNKIIIESAQMLSTAIRLGTDDVPEVLHKAHNPNHPVNKWVRSTRGNFLWTCEYFRAMLVERKLRTGRDHAHAIKFNGGQLFRNHKMTVPKGELQPFVNAAADKKRDLCFKHVSPTTLAYQMYLDARWHLEAESETYYPKATHETQPTATQSL